jgi:hypothetical protein
MSDQPVTRSLWKHRTRQTQNKRIYTPNYHAFSWIPTHDPRVSDFLYPDDGINTFV